MAQQSPEKLQTTTCRAVEVWAKSWDLQPVRTISTYVRIFILKLFKNLPGHHSSLQNYQDFFDLGCFLDYKPIFLIYIFICLNLGCENVLE